MDGVQPDGPGITVRGLLTAIDWDSSGRVCRVAILTHDEQEFELDLDERSAVLLLHHRQDVLVEGLLVGDPAGRKVLEVQRFELLTRRFGGTGT